MASVAAAQAYKKRSIPVVRTEAMARAERHNGRILDRIWNARTRQQNNDRSSVNSVGGAEARESSAATLIRRLHQKSVDHGASNNNKHPFSSSTTSTAVPSPLQPLLNRDGGADTGAEDTDDDFLCFVNLQSEKQPLQKGLEGAEQPPEGRRSQPPAPPQNLPEIVSPKEEDVGNTRPLLRLNIGGQLYVLLMESVCRAHRDTFLFKFVQLPHHDRIKVSDAWDGPQKAYYFQRSPTAFACIYQYYATGVVHKPPEMCPSEFTAELEFWRLPTQVVGSCCADAVNFSVLPHDRLADEDDQQDEDEKAFEAGWWFGRQFRRRLWTFLEKPSSSRSARAFELLSTMFVVISVAGLSFGTVPDFQVTSQIQAGHTIVRLPNGTFVEKPQYMEVRSEHPIFLLLERICIAFFTVEYIVRLFAAPRKLRFVLKPLNLVDLLAILPFYIELAMTYVGVDETKLKDLRWAFLVVRILRVLRVIRIIKLGRFSFGLQTFAMTLRKSQKQLQMMTIVLLTGVVFFSTLIYFLEKDEADSPFTSIPAAYWWCIVTMTTVGYGDVVPSTNLGKLIASVCIMCGVLVLALPITIIVDNFIKVAQEEQQMEQLKAELLARKEREWQRLLVVAADAATPLMGMGLGRSVEWSMNGGIDCCKN